MSALGRFVLWCLKHARQQGVFKRDLGRWGDVIREAWNAPDGGAAIRMIFRYIFDAPPSPQTQVNRQGAKTPSS